MTNFISLCYLLLWLFTFLAAVIPPLGRWIFVWLLRAQMEFEQFAEENGLKTWLPNLL